MKRSIDETTERASGLSDDAPQQGAFPSTAVWATAPAGVLPQPPSGAGFAMEVPWSIAVPMQERVPVLELRVFGGFDARVGGQPIASSYARQRKIQTLMSILALHHGEELYSDYVADSMWPRSTTVKKRHCFYNLWYLATHAFYEGEREDNPYFERRTLTCRLRDEHVRTDVQAVDDACMDLMRHGLEPREALEAYQRLQAAYRGDLLPAEMENAIIIRARQEWRERVSGALSAAAQSMMDAGDDRTALWLATVACRISGMREDVVRLRMELFSKMGMQAYAVRAFNELEEVLRSEVGMGPSPQSVQLMQEVAGVSGVPLAAPRPAPRRRGISRKAERERRAKADFPFGDALPARADIAGRPM